jgi:hypothetical protein
MANLFYVGGLKQKSRAERKVFGSIAMKNALIAAIRASSQALPLLSAPTDADEHVTTVSPWDNPDKTAPPVARIEQNDSDNANAPVHAPRHNQQPRLVPVINAS